MKQYYSNLKLILCTVVCVFATHAFALNNIHVFKKSTAPYTDLTGAISVTSDVVAHDSFLVSSLAGETFMLFGKQRPLVNYSIMIMKDGRIQFSEDTAFSVIDVLNSTPLETIDATSSVSYKLEGTGPDKILKVEWKNLRLKSGPAGNYFSAQTWIYQKTGIIEFRYGPRSANNASGYTNPVTAPYIGIWYSNYGWSNLHEKMQVTGTFPNFKVDSALAPVVPHVDGVPEEGTVFRFVPKAVATSVDKDAVKGDINIYPNPSNTEVVITSPLHINAVVRLAGIDGRVVYEGNMTGAKHVINAGNLSNGVYTLTVRGKNINAAQNINVQH